MADRTWVAFLRGMNVGGRRLTNDELAAAVTACGCDDVRTYQASGNVVMTDGRARADLTTALEEGLERELGYAVPTFLRSEEDVGAIAAATPFDADLVAASTGKLQVLLLRGAPDPTAASDALAHATDADRLALDDRQLYWLPSGGVADSDLDVAAIERLLGPTTTRTMGTIQRLADRFL